MPFNKSFRFDENVCKMGNRLMRLTTEATIANFRRHPHKIPEKNVRIFKLEPQGDLPQTVKFCSSLKSFKEIPATKRDGLRKLVDL